MTVTIKCVVCRRIIDGIEVVEDTEHIPEEDKKSLDVHICRGCARKDKLDKAIKEFKPFIEKFSHMVNRCGYDHDDIISDAIVACFFNEHRYLEQEMIIALIKILSKIGKESGNVCYEDPRNQWALKWCKAASKLEVYSND